MLEKINRGRLCTGCGMCAALTTGVRMERSVDGFHRPVVDTALDAEQNKRISEICPGLKLGVKRSEEDSPLWGHVLTLQTGYASNTDLRFRASSGGVLSALLEHLLGTEVIDFVVQTVADPHDPIGNRTQISTSSREVVKAAGSRYAPSSPLADIEKHLASGKRFAFVGKPCDVAALRALARIDPRVNANVHCMISFFCAGVPSRHGAREILERMGVRPDFLRSFRYRGHGWPGTASALLNDGSRRQMSYRDSWGGILSRHVQFRCKICPDGTGNAADIVCADPWHGGESGYPSFDEADGQSLVLTRTALGDAIVSDAARSGVISVEPCAIAELEAMQPGQALRMRVLIARLAALWITAQPLPAFRGFRLFRAAKGATIWALLRNFLGTGRRVIQGRR